MSKFIECDNNNGMRCLISANKIEFVFEVDTDKRYDLLIDTAATDGRIRLIYESARDRDDDYNQIRAFLSNSCDNNILLLKGIKYN